VNFDATDCQKICGLNSVQIHAVLGENVDEELIHRDNLTLMLP
jgi:glutamate 5-kinase